MDISYKNLSKYYYFDQKLSKIVNKRTHNPLIPDETDQISLYDPADRTKTRMKCNKACWILGHKENVPVGYRIIHVNMDKDDYRLQNLRLVSREEFLQMQEAKRNLSGELSLQIHPTDKYAFKLHYVKNGRVMTEIINDSVVAKRRYAVLQLHFAKILSKYCNCEV